MSQSGADSLFYLSLVAVLMHMEALPSLTILKDEVLQFAVRSQPASSMVIAGEKLRCRVCRVWMRRPLQVEKGQSVQLVGWRQSQDRNSYRLSQGCAQQVFTFA